MTSAARAPTQGTCLCGAVRYEIDGPFTMVVHCHCSMCRKHHGGSFATFAAAPLMGFRWISGADHITVHESSEKGRRYSCKTCGSVTPTVMKELDQVIVPAGNLEGSPDIRPSAHWFVTSKAPWHTITDSLPQHEEYPEEFGITGVTRMPSEPRPGIIAGSCLCGDVAYEVSGPFLRMVNCHCTRCRRGRSSSHATNLVCKIDDLRFVRGEGSVVRYKVPEARFFTVGFCRRCGGAAPHVSAERGIALIPAGSLDCDPGLRPQAHIFVKSGANWFRITDVLPQFAEAMP